MCVVLQICNKLNICSTTRSWQGGSLRAPVASPRPWLFQGIEPMPEPEDRIAGQPLAGEFSLPAPIDQGAIAPPEPTHTVWPLHHQSGERSCSPRYPHDHFMETTSSRPKEGSFRATLPWNHPIEQGRVPPLATPTNRPPFGCPQPNFT